MQALILKEMMAIDKERALTTMKGWAEFLRLAGGRQHTNHFATMEEYIPYRSIDVGKWLVIVNPGSPKNSHVLMMHETGSGSGLSHLAWPSQFQTTKWKHVRD